MSLGELVDNKEPKSHAANRVPSGHATHHGFEDGVQDLGRNSRTFVVNAQRGHRAAELRSHADRRRRASVRRCVAHQVADELGQPVGIQDSLSRSVSGVHDRLARVGHPQFLDGMGRHLVQIARL